MALLAGEGDMMKSKEVSAELTKEITHWEVKIYST